MKRAKKILIVASTHGHERIGLRVIEQLQKLRFTDNSVQFVIGNPQASELNVAYIESDLNRVFPGNQFGTYEEKRAFALSQKIKEFDIVIDIHSTKTTDLGEDSMVIVTNYNDETKLFLELIKPPKILIMKYKSGNALISQAKIGIAFEYGHDDSELVLKATVHDIAQLLMHCGFMASNPFVNPRQVKTSEVFEVYDAFRKEFVDAYNLNKNLTNFQLIHAGDPVCKIENTGEIMYAPEDFYPILFGKNRYTDILGFKARKIS